MKNRILNFLFAGFVLFWALFTYYPPVSASINNGFSPTGAAGGVLAGTYPNPTLATLAQRFIVSQAGAASAPAGTFTGAVYSGGDATTTKPLVLIEPTGATSTGWNTSGAMFGVNAASGFTGYLTDWSLNGVNVARMTTTGLTVAGSGGVFSVGAMTTQNAFNAATYGSATNCSSSASPAVCSTAAAGSVVVAASATTVQVNTTRVTANSQIFVMYDSSLGTKLSVTCNAAEPALYGVTARSAGASFTITATSPVTNPACFSYFIVN